MALSALVAFAEVDVPADVARNVPHGFIWLQLIGLFLGLAVLVGVGVWVVLRTRSMAKSDDDVVLEQSLEHFQKLLDAGEIEREEFERIRALLARRTSAPPSPPTDPGIRPGPPPSNPT